MLYYSYSHSSAFINPALRPTAANKTEGENNQHNEREFECGTAQLQLLIKTVQLS